MPSIEPPASLSALGRAHETPSRNHAPPSSGGAQPQRHHHSSYSIGKVKLRPWDGVALVDAVLADAQRHHIASLAPREVLHTSSPRINPTLILRDEIETTESVVHAFLLKMARDAPEAAAHAPALIAASAAATANRPQSAMPQEQQPDGSGDDVASPLRSRSRNGQRGVGGKKAIAGNLSTIIQLRASSAANKSGHSLSAGSDLNASSCFLSPAVRDKVPRAKAPAVGQYTPKFQVILRRGPSATMGTAVRSTAPGADSKSTETAADSHSKRAAGNTAAAAAGQPVQQGSMGGNFERSPSTLTGSPNSFAHGKQQPPHSTPFAFESEDGSTAQKPRRTGTSSFVSGSERFRAAHPTAYVANRITPWPLPVPGSRPQTAGAFSTVERASAFTGKAGPDAMLDPALIDRARSRTPCFVSMTRQTDRETQRGTRQLIEAERAAGGDIVIESTTVERVLSTHKRPATPMQFAKQISRPATPSGAKDHQPLPLHKLDAPRGFVDISRMVYSGERVLLGDPANEPHRTEPLNPSYDLVLNRAPTPTFGTAPRDTGMLLPSAAYHTGARPTSPAKGASQNSSELPPRGPSPTRPTSPANASGATYTTMGGGGVAGGDDLEQHWSSVRRRAPAVSMRGTNRSAPIMRTNRDVTPPAEYDHRPPERVPTPDIAHALSRSVRDLRYKAERGIDVVYDVPEAHPKGGALPFDKYTVRR